MLYNRALGYGNESNIPHNQIVIVQDYVIPFGKGLRFGGNSKGLVNALLGGWRVNGVTQFLSGEPFTATIGTYPSGYAAPNVGIQLPDRGTVSPYAGAAKNRSQWFVGGLGSAFLLPAASTFGNYGFNNLYGPIEINEDMALMKTFTVAEKYGITFRTDAFNAFNHTSLGVPDSTITDATAGKITSLATGTTMRRLQFALRLDF
jgi:hypothetical protein